MTTQTLNSRFVDEMKTEHPFAAGALARSIGMQRSYGCHFGMRSDLDRCRGQFYAGYDSANFSINNAR